MSNPAFETIHVGPWPSCIYFLSSAIFVKEINQADEIEYMRVNEGTGFSESL